MNKQKIPVLETLVVLGGNDTPWLAVLEKAGWLCHRCYDLRAAETLLLDVGPCIGVVDLTRDNFSLQAVAGITHRNKQVRWLALVREDQLKREAVCQFIVSFCIDYFTSPVPENQLLKTIGHQLGMLQLERQVWPQLGQFGQQGLQGGSPAMNRLRHQVKRIAMTDMPVLIHGEIGTGKELVARAVHQASTRAKGAFVAVGCEALTEEWLVADRADSPARSCIEAAQGGVVYLDEVTALAPERQLELVKWLKEERFIHADSSQPKSDIRVIAATRYSAEELLEGALIHDDLYFQLNILNLQVPALRERDEDIVLLAEYLLLKLARQYNSPAKQLSAGAKRMLSGYSWPGNIRELISQLKRAILLVDGKELDAEHFDLPRLVDDRQSLKQIREDSERGALLAVLENNKGQISAAARELGVSRATMYRLLNKHDLVPPPRNFRQG